MDSERDPPGMVRGEPVSTPTLTVVRHPEEGTHEKCPHGEKYATMCYRCVRELMRTYGIE